MELKPHPLPITPTEGVNTVLCLKISVPEGYKGLPTAVGNSGIRCVLMKRKLAQIWLLVL